MTGTPPYTIEALDRRERLRYRRGDLVLDIARTWARGERLFTQAIQAPPGQPPLPLAVREQVMRDLCDAFSSRPRELRFVIEKGDADRAGLEAAVARMAAEGARVRAVLDSPARRRAAEDREIVSALKQGWRVTVDGIRFGSPEAFRAWRKGR